MGGVSRHTCASTYPSDRFYCLLDELPLHLIPRHMLSSVYSPGEHKEELRLNPLCQFLRDGEVPSDLGACRDFLDGFALQGTVAWVRQPETDVLSPFWVGPKLESVLANYNSGQFEPGCLSESDAQLLSSAGILSSAGSSVQAGQLWRAQIARSAQMFEQRSYAPTRNLIHPFHVAALRRYYRNMIRAGNILLGDVQSSRRYVAHNESVARFFHHQIAPAVSAVVGEPVKPSYVYLASYMSGAELKKHTDREQCEFSITLCLDFSPEPRHETPWPIRLEPSGGEVIVYQGLGDGLVYRGTRVPHYRSPLPEGQTSTSMFFHYVPQDFAGSLN